MEGKARPGGFLLSVCCAIMKYSTLVPVFAARVLGIHRTRLYRKMKRHGLDSAREI